MDGIFFIYLDDFLVNLIFFDGSVVKFLNSNGFLDFKFHRVEIPRDKFDPFYYLTPTRKKFMCE